MSIDVTASASFSAQVAEEIRVVMARRLLRQSELARTLGVTEQWLSVRLRGKQPIDLNDLAAIAAALGVRPADLLAGRTTNEYRAPGRLPQVKVPPGRQPTATPPHTRPPNYPSGPRRPVLLSGKPTG